MRLAILTCHRTGFASRCLEALAASAQCDVALVVLSKAAAAKSPRARGRKLRKVMKIGLAGALNGVRMRAWYADDPAEDIEALCARLDVPFAQTPSLNGAATRKAFAASGADLGLSLGNSYISERLFRTPKHGMLNFHGELLPQYQNAQSVIWPIHNGERMTGFTIHAVDKGIDTGAILFREEVAIAFRPQLKDTVIETNRRVRERAVAAMVDVCERYSELSAAAQPQSGLGRSYTTPSIWQFARMCRNNRALYRRAALAPAVADDASNRGVGTDPPAIRPTTRIGATLR